MSTNEIDNQLSINNNASVSSTEASIYLENGDNIQGESLNNLLLASNSEHNSTIVNLANGNNWKKVNYEGSTNKEITINNDTIACQYSYSFDTGIINTVDELMIKQDNSNNTYVSQSL